MTHKQNVAIAAAARVRDGQVIGLGSGSTVELAVECIGKRVIAEGLRICGVPTSLRIAKIAADCGLKVLSPYPRIPLDWAFDGADEVDPQLNLIKGAGAAMLGEKIIASRAKSNFLIIVTEDKLVSKLGEKFAVPIEVIADAQYDAIDELQEIGATLVKPRESSAKYGPTISERGNVILDATFERFTDDLEKRIKQCIGVVESGLFLGYASEVLYAADTGVWSLQKTTTGVCKSQAV